MRKILAAVALTGAAFTMATPPASASGCYGAQGWATACYEGEAGVQMYDLGFCIYTGGQSCTTYEVPYAWPQTPYYIEVCAWLAGCTNI